MTTMRAVRDMLAEAIEADQQEGRETTVDELMGILCDACDEEEGAEAA